MEESGPSSLDDKSESREGEAERQNAERQAASSGDESEVTNEKRNEETGQSSEAIGRDGVVGGNEEGGGGINPGNPVTRFLATGVGRRGRKTNRERLNMEKDVDKGCIEKWLDQGGEGVDTMRGTRKKRKTITEGNGSDQEEADSDLG